MWYNSGSNRARNFKSASRDLKLLARLLPELYSTQPYYGLTITYWLEKTEITNAFLFENAYFNAFRPAVHTNTLSVFIQKKRIDMKTLFKVDQNENAYLSIGVVELPENQKEFIDSSSKISLAPSQAGVETYLFS